VNPAGCATAPRSAAAAQPGGQVLPGEFLLRDGTPALIWPLLPTDAEALRDGFRRLSPDSRQHRFLTVLAELDDSMIRRLVDSVDGVQHIALVLTVLPPEGEEGPVGVAHLLQYPDDPATADIAVTVADDWQGRGAGTALVSALLERRPAAVTRLRTAVEAGNRASLALLAGAGHVSSGLPERGVLDVTVELAAPARPARTPTARLITPIPSGIASAPPLTRLLRGYGQRVAADQLGLSSTAAAVGLMCGAVAVTAAVRCPARACRQVLESFGRQDARFN
jgi:RimJ/RimL family protein N-acetyltransferase